ncbi:transcription elongation factor 1 [Exophiala viscosa]|uniref:transcription elongation factor 1 n=1 Tax=Exophiala viscosa TaxID=2486360 RepID=UPI0021946B62|nr:transcription elongation factor 1 [Exophiala viscosa]
MAPRKATTAGIRKPRKKARLPKIFSCLVCDRNDVVRVEMRRKKKTVMKDGKRTKKTVREGVGKLQCSSCHVKFDYPIGHLSAEVDVYSAWVDSLEAQNEAKKAAVATSTTTGN